MTAIPTLETERLILKGPTLDDYPDIAAMWGDPEVVEYIGGVPFKPEDTWARLLRYAGHWALLGFGSWVVRDKAGTYVGDVGLFDLHRDLEPKLEIPELGWVLAKHAHGKGYATEAVQRILAWGEQHFGPRPFSCIIDTGNQASHRVAQKCGFQQRAVAEYKGTPVVVYRRDELMLG
jgi:RimJ/RimL family protein N-acetyltransferase